MRPQPHPTPYPSRLRWSKVFKPHLTAVRPTIQAAVETVCPEFDATLDIPREAGWCIDTAWPRSRTGALAHQCYGYCHHVAAYMFDLARKGLPRRKWWIVNAESHSAVIAHDGTVIDLNAEDAGSLGERRKLHPMPDLSMVR